MKLKEIRRKQNDIILSVLKCKVMTEQQEEDIKGNKNQKEGKYRKFAS